MTRSMVVLLAATLMVAMMMVMATPAFAKKCTENPDGTVTCIAKDKKGKLKDLFN